MSMHVRACTHIHTYTLHAHTWCTLRSSDIGGKEQQLVMLPSHHLSGGLSPQQWRCITCRPSHGLITAAVAVHNPYQPIPIGCPVLCPWLPATGCVVTGSALGCCWLCAVAGAMTGAGIGAGAPRGARPRAHPPQAPRARARARAGPALPRAPGPGGNRVRAACPVPSFAIHQVPTWLHFHPLFHLPDLASMMLSSCLSPSSVPPASARPQGLIDCPPGLHCLL